MHIVARKHTNTSLMDRACACIALVFAHACTCECECVCVCTCRRGTIQTPRLSELEFHGNLGNPASGLGDLLQTNPPASRPSASQVAAGSNHCSHQEPRASLSLSLLSLFFSLYLSSSLSLSLCVSLSSFPSHVFSIKQRNRRRVRSPRLLFSSGREGRRMEWGACKPGQREIKSG